MDTKIVLSELPTYIYIDASNISNACKRSSGFEIDFLRLLTYFQKKYSKLQNVAYFEGISNDDQNAIDRIERLSNAGYSVLSLSRKAYKSSNIIKEIACISCGDKQSHTIFEAKAKLKSNIDVFLATEVMYDSSQLSDLSHIILVSCDGDYAEMIKKILSKYENIYVSVLATPTKKHRMNYLSSRFKELERMPKYSLINIENFKDYIRTLRQDEKKQ